MIILGSGGHAKEILDILIEKNYNKEIIFINTLIKDKEKLFNKYNVINSLKNLSNIQNDFIIGVGDINLRKKLAIYALSNNLNWTGIRSKNSIIGKLNVEIDLTVDIMQNVQISSEVSIGKGTLVNRNVSIHHNVIIGKNNVISPGVQLLGGCEIGNNVFIGAGSIILPKIKIEDDVVIGAGSLVNKNVSRKTKVFGNPAR